MLIYLQRIETNCEEKPPLPPKGEFNQIPTHFPVPPPRKNKTRSAMPSPQLSHRSIANSSTSNKSQVGKSCSIS